MSVGLLRLDRAKDLGTESDHLWLFEQGVQRGFELGSEIPCGGRDTPQGLERKHELLRKFLTGGEDAMHPERVHRDGAGLRGGDPPASKELGSGYVRKRDRKQPAD